MIYITLDFELFLGFNSGSVQRSLVEPMNHFISILNNYGVKATLFVDAAYLYMLRKLKDSNAKLKEDEYIVTKLISDLSDKGHDIQLHIHPQWFFSSYSNNNWQLDFSHYKLSDMSQDELCYFFSSSKKILQDVASKKICGFRAGGYTLSTLNNYSTFMYKNGIYIDSSVLTGAYKKTSAQYYDYRKAPQKGLYRFSSNVIEEDTNGQLIELPITTERLSSFNYMKKKRELARQYEKSTPWGDGVGIGQSVNPIVSVVRKLARLPYPCVLPASIDGVMSEYLIDLYNRNAIANNVFTIIGHPKSFSPTSLQNMEKFIKYSIEIDEYGVVSCLAIKN